MDERRREDRGDAPDTGRDPTASQLRDDIDSGRTHDKVHKDDPATVPLGTDAEAGGNPPTPGEVATARQAETARTVADKPTASRTETQTARRPNTGMIWAIAAVVVVAILLAFLF